MHRRAYPQFYLWHLVVLISIVCVSLSLGRMWIIPVLQRLALISRCETNLDVASAGNSMPHFHLVDTREYRVDTGNKGWIFIFESVELTLPCEPYRKIVMTDRLYTIEAIHVERLGRNNFLEETDVNSEAGTIVISISTGGRFMGQPIGSERYVVIADDGGRKCISRAEVLK